MHWRITVLDQHHDGQEFKLLILAVDCTAVGSCQIAGWNEDRPSILGVMVDPNYRGDGYGTELIQKVIELATDAGKTGVSLTVEPENGQAIRLYERLGFKVDLSDSVQVWMSLDIPRKPKANV